jgi:hypothetical protein
LVAAEVVATSYKDVARRLGVSTISVRRYLIRSNARPFAKTGPKPKVGITRVERVSPELQSGAE